MSGGFESLSLMPEVLRAVQDLGWSLPTDIQDEAIPLILGGGDVMAAAETGSGKTAAFALPIIQCVYERLSSSPSQSNDSSKDCKALNSGNKIINIGVSLVDKDEKIQVDNVGSQYYCYSITPNVWCGARADFGVREGLYFFEGLIKTPPGGGDKKSALFRLGWSTMAAHLELGKDAHGFGYGGKGFTSTDGRYEQFGGEYGEGDVVGCYINLDHKTILFSVNGSIPTKAFDLPEHCLGSVFFPAVLVQMGGIVVNFGQSGFRFPPSAEYRSLCQAIQGHIFSANDKESFVVHGKRKPLALIVEPTRDLAEQVYQSFVDLSKYVTEPVLITKLLIGDDRSKLDRQAASVDIVVGTLGKLNAMIKSKILDLSQIRFLILDEADKLLSQESISSVMSIYSNCPGGGTGQNRLQVCFFSATLHSLQIRDLASKICMNPTWVDLKGFESVPDTVHHVVYRINPSSDIHHVTNAKIQSITDGVHLSSELTVGADGRKMNQSSQLTKEIKQQIIIKIIDKFKMDKCLIFCRTNLDCQNLETFFNSCSGSKYKSNALSESGKENKYSCLVLAGMRTMEERRLNLQAFKNSSVRILICTDVAARGIDIDGLPYVINMTLPDQAEDYIHRIGRVGRADKMGLAISLVSSDDIQEKVWYHTCANRGKDCQKRSLTHDGGCTIWYDEAMILAKVEARLHFPIPNMSIEFELPHEIASLNIHYGEDVKKVDESNQEYIIISNHINSLSDSIKDLANMEREAQNQFLDMNMIFR
eukprot:gene13075-17527_t